MQATPTPILLSRDSWYSPVIHLIHNPISRYALEYLKENWEKLGEFREAFSGVDLEQMRTAVQPLLVAEGVLLLLAHEHRPEIGVGMLALILILSLWCFPRTPLAVVLRLFQSLIRFIMCATFGADCLFSPRHPLA